MAQFLRHQQPQTVNWYSPNLRGVWAKDFESRSLPASSSTSELNEKKGDTSVNGAQAFLKALVDAGPDTCFANPGPSEMQLASSPAGWKP